MNAELVRLLDGLGQAGWTITRLAAARALPREVLERYPWFPGNYRELAEETQCLVSPNEKAWLLTVSDYSGSTDSAYAWNEWERQSLEAGGENESWKSNIRKFWDDHLPILTSVKTGYSYLAIERSGLTIVCGQEPEYEEVRVVAASLEDLLGVMASGDNRLRSLL